MTARELYEYALIEVNKLEAPSLLLEDYNYFINKAVQQYINLVYNRYDVNQQSTDDLRVWKATSILTPQKITELSEIPDIKNGILSTTYYVNLPLDYIHLLNCIVEYTLQKENFKCYKPGEKVYFAARRLTSDMYGQIINNAYMCPTYKRPYYFINNINISDKLPTNKTMDDSIINDNTHKKEVKGRLSNASNVRLELRFGSDDIFKPSNVYIDYVKAPMYIQLTHDQIDDTVDQSQLLEFPDYICFEIVNIFTKLIMENASDPRLQTNIPINHTIATGISQEQTK